MAVNVRNRTIFVRWRTAPGEDWQQGNSLDAFNGLLHVGFGAMAGTGEAEIIWKDVDHSRKVWGYAVTKQFYESKLHHGSPFNQERFRQELEALEQGEGRTYSDLLMEVIADHSHVASRFIP